VKFKFAIVNPLVGHDDKSLLHFPSSVLFGCENKHN
jgi:hypothetical protein